MKKLQFKLRTLLVLIALVAAILVFFFSRPAVIHRERHCDGIRVCAVWVKQYRQTRLVGMVVYPRNVDSYTTFSYFVGRNESSPGLTIGGGGIFVDGVQQKSKDGGKIWAYVPRLRPVSGRTRLEGAVSPIKGTLDFDERITPANFDRLEQTRIWKERVRPVIEILSAP